MAEIMFPVGRFVGGGSLYKMFPVTDNKGQPKHQSDGTPQVRCNFGVAIPKDPSVPHWFHTDWGKKIVAIAQAGFPNGEFNSPTFAWKVTDGDSQVPNKKGNKPCDQAGYRGHWVIWFSQSWLPKLCNADGSQVLTEPDAIVPGYFIQVLGDVTDNKPSESPGVYMNPKAVALAAYGEKIISAGEVDTTKAGFGGAPLPAGASAAPIGQMVAPPPAAVTMPPIPGATPAPTVVQPNSTYMAPSPPAAGAGAPPPPAAAARTVHNAATGQTVLYSDMLAQNWTDALLAANGWV